MKILVACEFSGVVRDSFIEKGHEAISCDILPTEQEGPHIQGDVTKHLQDKWDMIIAHPPCTYLCNSGVRHLSTDPSRWDRLKEACLFFNLFLLSTCPRICVENPIPHKYAVQHLATGNYTQIVQPWMFGHPEKKATCLWLKGLPKLVETDNVKEVMKTLPAARQSRIHYMAPGPERSKKRSVTYSGLAKAMAQQWG